MINILKGISIALSGKGKQLLLGGAFVILPFLSFVWNGIWEYRILIFLAMMVFFGGGDNIFAKFVVKVSI